MQASLNAIAQEAGEAHWEHDEPVRRHRYAALDLALFVDIFGGLKIEATESFRRFQGVIGRQSCHAVCLRSRSARASAFLAGRRGARPAPVPANVIHACSAPPH